MRQLKGCDNPIENPWQFEGFAFDRCPNHYLDDAEFLRDAFRIYAWKEKGVLPYPGCLIDQPNIILEVCDYLDSLMAYKQKNEYERMKREPNG